MQRLLITGSNGLLGAKLITHAQDSYEVVGVSRQPAAVHASVCASFHQIDVRDRKGVASLLQRARPDAVIHTAATTDVDGCETNPQEAWDINTGGAENVALACRDVGAHLILVSTDYVFSGDNGPYREDDPPNPISVYGKTKLEAERLVTMLCPDAAIGRTSTLFGHAPGVRPNFVTWLIAALSQGQRATIVTDQTSSPTLADDLASMLVTLVECDSAGVFHTAGREWLTRYELARRICQTFGLDSSLITPTTTDALQQAAPRPRHSGLVTQRVYRELGISPLAVADALFLLKVAMESAQA